MKKSSHKISIVRPPSAPKHLPQIALSLAVSLIILSAIKQGRRPTKTDMKKLSSSAVRGIFML
jgi:hypothetical protein